MYGPYQPAEHYLPLDDHYHEGGFTVDDFWEVCEVPAMILANTHRN